MKRFTLMVVMLLPLALPETTSAQVQPTSTQTFNSEIPAAAAGWREFDSRVNGFDFGFSATNNAEGTSGAGEGGGVIVRSGPAGYYGDIELDNNPNAVIPGDLTLNLHASGRIKFQDENFDGAWYFGWFSREKVEGPDNVRDYLGISVTEPRSGMWRVRASVDGNDGEQMNLPNDVPLDFTIDWDADGGSGGNGLLTVNITTADGAESFTSVSDNFDDMTFDSFGLLANAQSGGQLGRFWFDDLEYSVIEGGDTPAPVPGDANGDRVVDLADFEIILANIFDAAPRGENGDVTFDGFVDFDDFHLWKDEHAAGSVGSAAAIPEPVGAGLALVLAFAVLLARPRTLWRW